MNLSVVREVLASQDFDEFCGAIKRRAINRFDAKLVLRRHKAIETIANSQSIHKISELATSRGVIMVSKEPPQWSVCRSNTLGGACATQKGKICPSGNKKMAGDFQTEKEAQAWIDKNCGVKGCTPEGKPKN